MYDQIAHLYDLVHQELMDDVDFVVKLAAQSGEPVLELGCGTGRLLLPLARTGHVVTGLDNSAAMLGIAEQKITSESKAVKQRIELVDGDMTSFGLKERFRMIIVPHNTLMHLNRAQVDDCLRCIRRQLHENGRLFIDVENPLISADSTEDDLLMLERTMIDPISGATVLQMASSWVDTEIQLRQIVWIFDSTPQGGGSIQRLVVKEKFHYLFAHELEVALEAAGLKLDSTFGDYDGENYGEGSPRLLMVASPR